jgi:hypothetical protein
VLLKALKNLVRLLSLRDWSLIKSSGALKDVQRPYEAFVTLRDHWLKACQVSFPGWSTSIIIVVTMASITLRAIFLVSCFFLFFTKRFFIVVRNAFGFIQPLEGIVLVSAYIPLSECRSPRGSPEL